MAPILPDSIKKKINHYAHQRWAVIVFSSLILTAWTLLRFFDSSPNFDQVGQQVLAHQWLHGMHSGSVIGPTNYVIKMLLIYFPFDLIALPGLMKLIFITLLINIFSFILLIYSLERIWLEFYPKIKNTFYLPVIYLSLISGSVYWISFANSRNLEVACGVLLTALLLRAQRLPTKRNYLLVVVLGSFLFFADPLQIYMSLLPALIFVGAKTKRSSQKHKYKIILNLFGYSLLAIVFSRLLIHEAESIWNISFITNNQSPSFVFSSIKQGLEQLAKLYAGGYEGGRLREILDVLVLLIVIFLASYHAWRKTKSKPLLSLIAVIWIINIAVYVVSGQAAQLDTNRYLIMTVPAFILAVALVLNNLPSTRLIKYSVSAILGFNILCLALAFCNAWDPHFSRINHDRIITSYMEDHQYSYGYSSIGTALSSDYLSNWKINILPLGCDADYILKQTNLFFDKAAFDISKDSKATNLVPIILDGGSIKINYATCTAGTISKQLGVPEKSDKLDDGSNVLFYKPAQLGMLRPTDK